MSESKDITPITQVSGTDSSESPTLDPDATFDSSKLASPPTGFGDTRTTTEPIFVGPYRLIRKIGEGGMGQVWLAEQTEPVQRQVALKLIKVGRFDDEVLKRFRSERQSLAIMDHPSIAKVFDAGSTPDGQPYFVMEYVSGALITDYCDWKRLAIPERLQLFIKVCEGVQHAHQKAIIHRDLKPANILVVEVDGKPVPRIIDFGLAKATTPQIGEETAFTQVGHFVGTPGYMSPEQADSSVLDVDTRTDVYSLGVVLYVLLTGELPFDSRKWQKKSMLEVLKQLREEDPVRPSTKVGGKKEFNTSNAEKRGVEPRQLVHLLHGDLDWIAMKALEKDRTRRYGTPSELAADITRYLNHEPVVARPASAGYRLKKYVRRHRIAVAVATGLVVLLAAFGTMQAVQLRRTTRERDRANRERDRATRITDFMTTMFKVSDPSETRGNSITAREILDKASKSVHTGLAKDPETQAQMMQVMGEVYGNLGLYSSEHALEQQSLEIRRRVLGPEHPDTLKSMFSLSRALWNEGRFSESEKLQRETLDLQRRVLGPEHPDTLRSMTSLARYHDGSAESQKLLSEAFEIQRRVLGPEHADTLSTMNLLALTSYGQGHYAEAEKLDREILQIRRRVLGPDNPSTLGSMGGLASVLRIEGRVAEAEKLHREQLDVDRKVFGPEHPATLSSMNSLAEDLALEGHYPEAEKMQREVLDGHRRVLGPEHANTAESMSRLGWYLCFEGQYAEAEKLARPAVDILRRARGPEDPYTTFLTSKLAWILDDAGHHAEAEKLLRETLDIQRRVDGPEDGETALSVYYLGVMAAHQGNSAEALSLLRQAIDHGLHPVQALVMENDPDLKSLRGDPGFDALVAYSKERVALAQNPK
jgi:eukaryotic-like serine/threonine-protein kinase